MASHSSQSLPTISDAPWLSWPETKFVAETIMAAGFTVRAVGGAVRNALLGAPVVEIDFATDALPQKVVELAEAAGLAAIPTGLAHGTVTVVAGDRAFEVTTLRADIETHGRHATVAFTADWSEDAKRRDFTMNALYADLDGQIFDPLGGYADLQARRVRFIGDPVERIREDYLRILRYFRISAQYGEAGFCQPDLEACVSERAGLKHLSAERVRAELLLLLVAPDAVAALEAMYERGLITNLLSGVSRLTRLRNLIRVESDLGLGADALRRLFALEVVVEHDIDRLTNRLKISNVEAKRMGLMLGAGAGTPAIDEPKAKALLYRLSPESFVDFCTLALAQAADPHVIAGWAKVADLAARWSAPSFPLSGGDLVDLGLIEGPDLGELLETLEHNWVGAGCLDDRAALLGYAQSMIKARSK